MRKVWKKTFTIFTGNIWRKKLPSCNVLKIWILWSCVFSETVALQKEYFLNIYFFLSDNNLITVLSFNYQCCTFPLNPIRIQNQHSQYHQQVTHFWGRRGGQHLKQKWQNQDHQLISSVTFFSSLGLHSFETSETKTRRKSQHHQYHWLVTRFGSGKVCIAWEIWNRRRNCWQQNGSHTFGFTEL